VQPLPPRLPCHVLSQKTSREKIHVHLESKNAKRWSYSERMSFHVPTALRQENLRANSSKFQVFSFLHLT
jgi:hypothetical protein